VAHQEGDAAGAAAIAAGQGLGYGIRGGIELLEGRLPGGPGDRELGGLSPDLRREALRDRVLGVGERPGRLGRRGLGGGLGVQPYTTCGRV
jgi:hypothetical protein